MGLEIVYYVTIVFGHKYVTVQYARYVRIPIDDHACEKIGKFNTSQLGLKIFLPIQPWQAKCFPTSLVS
jgi:hypothetical protein